ncbi:vib [Bugula neritina]|uniref:Vib n=1 Tax=Bugula neritina TaxID=10212 RepID=A0A7J7JDS9_BUGNE|nr:vib [Bugula neritina]
MLITEFRIILPMTVEEYHVGQLYSIAETSKNETGGGEGVEFVDSYSYTGNPIFFGEFPDGQYTQKVHHMASKVPQYIRALAPKGSIELREEAWNAYPYCKTVVTNPVYMKDGMFISIETMHLADKGETENVHRLTPEELEQRKVIYIDIANDKVVPTDYKANEDPAKFKSEKTGRGPLDKNWIETSTPVMCCYKLVKCEFKWHGLQPQVENLILRVHHRMFTNFYRQMFCQIDQWYGLTMEDIRAIEEKTKNELNELRETSSVKGTMIK